MIGPAAIWAAIKAFGIWGRIGAALRWITASTARCWAALAILALAYAAWQFRRAEDWQNKLLDAQASFAAERKAAASAKAAAETRYRSLADNADAQHDAALAQGDARLAAYIAAHRLRASAPDPARAAQGDGSAIPESPTPGPIVAALTISEADLRICDQNYSYALSAHLWAQGLTKEP
ncbi:hypothetical protein [Novosphingobium sediminicola]|uniref:Uncharacterized protein n=1 Tax=Novosphingobium sediminicola TaxID=563162 RepID=A0A7W6CJR3_9SPHN|nr:hypothetical protein [Novosphingobium sediminicola]MBB3955924.1 hypothetical protein [Novosphingobium sediminicola]